MKKYEILYDWPIAQISHLADSEAADTYSGGLSPALLTSFTQLTEQMRGLGADLAVAKAARQHFAKWDDLGRCLESFESKFSDFPAGSVSKLRLSILLAGKLADMDPALDSQDINKDIFEIRELTVVLPVAWFSRENKKSFCDSMAVFTCKDFVTLKSEIEAWNLSPDFAFHFLAALHALAVIPAGHAVLVKKSAQRISNAAIDAFVNMVILATGKYVHAPRRYNIKPFVLDPDSIRPGNLYQQWADVLTVISEYNSRDEVLLKYLTIYHVVENFMFKLPIVGLERQQDGRMFSIRDFRRLYKKVEMLENGALRQLFSVVFRQVATSGTTFEQQITARWSALVPNLQETEIDTALLALGLSFTHSRFVAQGAPNSFADLAYAIRNAIVHNKETEFHLTYASMDPCVCALIEKFLIPSLEEICFTAIGSPNDYLWYKNQSLLLYK